MIHLSPAATPATINITIPAMTQTEILSLAHIASTPVLDVGYFYACLDVVWTAYLSVCLRVGLMGKDG